MAFEKGKSGNAQGRKRGTPNRTTGEAKEIFNGILSGEMDHIKTALDKVRTKNPYQYLDILSKLLQYVYPKASTIDVSLDFDQLNEQQVDLLISKLFKIQNNE